MLQKSRGPDFSSTTASDRKSTRLNSSHQIISYAVFCLKKKDMMQNSVHVYALDSQGEPVIKLLPDVSTPAADLSSDLASLKPPTAERLPPRAVVAIVQR